MTNFRDYCDRYPAKNGFTLVELLVVIAVISVLAAILIPIVSSAHAHTRNLQCVSNLRGLGSAVNLYLQDNDNILPRSSTAATSTSPASNWVFKLSGYPGRIGIDYIDATYGSGQLKSISSKRKSLLLCRDNIDRSGIKSSSAATTYMFNRNCSELSVDQALRPSMLALFVEGLPISGSNTWNLATLNGADMSIAAHGNHSNVLFLDGHVGIVDSIPDVNVRPHFWMPM